MLYVFSGDDTSRVYHESRQAITKTLDQGAHLYEAKGAHTAGEYEDLAGGDSLFGTLRTFVFEDALDTAEAREAFLVAAESLVASPHLFVFRSGKLPKEALEGIKKTGAKLWEILLPEKRKQAGFNIFALADAFGERDKKKAWVLFTEAIKEGISAEEIHGTIFWMARSLMLVKKADGKEDTGLSPYVLTKATRFAKGFSEEELRSILDRLVAMYHDAHRGLSDLESDLERFILTATKK